MGGRIDKASRLEGQVESLSQGEPGVAAKPGADHALFQLPAAHTQGPSTPPQRGIAEPVAAARSTEPLHDSVARTGAGAGENYAMNAHPTSAEVGRVRGTALSRRPIPKTKLGRLHKNLDPPDL